MDSARADSEDVHKAQLGCVDCLALLVSVQLGAAYGSAAAAAEQKPLAAAAAALYPELVIEEANGHARASPSGGPAHQPSSAWLLLGELVDALSWRRSGQVSSTVLPRFWQLPCIYQGIPTKQTSLELLQGQRVNPCGSVYAQHTLKFMVLVTTVQRPCHRATLSLSRNSSVTRARG